MILVFDLGGPLLAYSLLRSAGMSAVAALAIVVTTSTGIALVCSKLIPYVFAVVLSAWTLVYGEHEKKKAERLASSSVDAGT